MKSRFLVGPLICLAVITPLGVARGIIDINAVTNEEWETYKTRHNKIYPNAAGTNDVYARYYYTYHKRLINAHNLQADQGVYTYKLALNQFSDMRFLNFRALFPRVQPMSTAASSRASLPNFAPNVSSFDPKADLGFEFEVGNQGTVCNSGWAYATAKAVEVLKASEMGNMKPAALSAQNLIDCAGTSRGCTNQHPQAAFDYLTLHGQELYREENYPNDRTSTQQNMCIRPTEPGVIAETLNGYANVNDGDDETVRRLLPTHPVVVEYDPTSFQFMHYASGVFQKPASYSGSHFLTVIGFGRDENTGKDYWLALNSFGDTWGEGGFIKILRDSLSPIAKTAIVPVS